MLSDRETSNNELNPALARGNAFPTWRCFAKTGALFATIAGFLLLQSCGGKARNPEDDMETVEIVDTISVQEPTKGLITTVKEVQPKQFAIENEEVIDNKDSSRVIVKYLDGRTERLTVAQAKALVAPQDSAAAQDTALHVQLSAQDSAALLAVGDTSAQKNTTIIVNNTTPHTYNSGYSPSLHTLGYVLMGGALGYYMGKSMNTPPNPNIYQNPRQTYYNNRRDERDSTRRNSSSYSSLRSTAKTAVVRKSSYQTVPRATANEMKRKAAASGRTVTTVYNKPSKSSYGNSSKSGYGSTKSSNYSSSKSGGYYSSGGSNYSGGSTYKSTPSNSKSGYFSGGSSSKSSSYSSGGSSYSGGRSSYSGGSSYSG